MTRTERRALHLSNVLVGGTGLAYFVFRYLFTPESEFAVVNHPWQPHAQHLHILFAPALVFAAGLIWQQHAFAYWQRKMPRKRKTGITLMATLIPMIVSGYFIQTAVDAGWRDAWIVIHLATSFLWLGGYLLHWRQTKRPERL